MSPAVPDSVLREADGALVEGNPKRALAVCLGALGAPPRAIAGPTGPGWVGHVQGAWVFAAFDRALGAVLLEVPVARITRETRAAALRRALELSSFDGFRLCLRANLVVDRFGGRAPADARSVARLIADLVSHARGATRRFVAELGAAPPPRAGEADPDAALFGFGDGASQEDFEPDTVRVEMPPSRRAVDDELPPILAFGASSSSADDLPPVLTAPAPVTVPSATLEEGNASSLEIRAPTPPRGMLRSEAGAPNDTQARMVDLLDATRALALVAAAGSEGTRLVELVVRATSYRAVHEFAHACPSAVATLIASTPEAISETKRGRDESAAAEAAMLLVERLLETPTKWSDPVSLRVPPLRSSAEVREHLRRYARLIEGSPPDTELRYHLLLGSLSELLGRTKLPEQTQARLRDIVTFARKQGSRASSIDLMMTALSRITA